VDSSPRQRAGTQRPVCQGVFDEAQDHCFGTSTVLTDLVPCAFFFISEDQICVKMNQVLVRRSNEGKSDGALLPKVEDSHGVV